MLAQICDGIGACQPRPVEPKEPYRRGESKLVVSVHMKVIVNFDVSE